ncbi:Transcriptional regulator, TetR family [plant metagenome]|uniref:Transcriptional regulator, TetR family n=2 Tax=root TaxID=1 RepID=A0A1C3JXY0_9BURK|nr:TetR/AcrR family transcriptional regulator [Orrella dioscoreae]SBT24100.1 Transcriptional regulator, TetR family [Orrella dioscoreae]SOE51471.1 Transcriptional regulator, TetR family [Orrella dioscoreae]
MNATAANTREQLLDYAQSLIGARGCNGFSYRDLADHVGVKTSSIHYYFPCKDDLVREAIEAYSQNAIARVHAIDASLPADEKLRRYADVLEGVVCSGKQLCIGGVLAADMNSLPESVRCVVKSFFLAMEAWLAAVLREGVEQGTVTLRCDAETSARALFAAVQGSMLSTRVFGDCNRIRETITSVCPSAGSPSTH